MRTVHPFWCQLFWISLFQPQWYSQPALPTSTSSAAWAFLIFAFHIQFIGEELLPRHMICQAFVLVAMAHSFHDLVEQRITKLPPQFRFGLLMTKKSRHFKVIQIPHLHSGKVTRLARCLLHRFSRFERVCDTLLHVIAPVVEFRLFFRHGDHQVSRVDRRHGSLPHPLSHRVYAEKIQHCN